MRDKRNNSLTFLSFCSALCSLNEVACRVNNSSKDVGTVDYRVLRQSPWFVDKTMLLNELAQRNTFVYLFTYPRRWGKTINLHMVELYFTHLDATRNKLTFEKTNISKCKNCELAHELQGKLPVIYLDFSEIKPICYTREEFLISMKTIIANTYATYEHLKKFIEEKYGKNSKQLNRFNDYCSDEPTDYILRTEEIAEKEKRIDEKEKRIHEKEKRIHEKEKWIHEKEERIHEEKKPYLDLKKLQIEETAEVTNMKNISLAEKEKRMKAIDSLYEPRLKRARVDESSLRQSQKDLENLRKDLENLRTSRDKCQKEIDEIKSGEVDRLEKHVCRSVEFLATMLHEATGRKSIVLIDEYDAPVNQAPITTLRHILPVLTEFMGKTFKRKSRKDEQASECFVDFGVITGILRIAKQGMFSKVNNLSEYNMLNNPMMEYFGFTDPEVKRLIQIFKKKYSSETLTEENLRNWYDGYRMLEDSKTVSIDASSHEFYCPWSIVKALDDKKTGNHFTESGTWAGLKGVIMSPIMEPVIKNLIRNNTEPMTVNTLSFELEDLEHISQLSDKTKESTDKDKTLTLRLLFAAGYLTLAIDEKDSSVIGVKAANQEIREEFLRLFLLHYEPEGGFPTKKLNAASDAFNYVFETGDVTDFCMRYQDLLEAFPVFTKDKHGKGLFYNEHNCQVVMEAVDLNLFLKARRHRDFRSGELTYRQKSGDRRRSDIIYYRADIKTAIVIEMRTKGTVFKALRDAKKKYSEYLDGFRDLQKKIFIGVHVGIDKKVQMRVAVEPNPKFKNPNLLSTGQPK